MDSAEVKVGMTVYGRMNSADGYFEAEGIVTEVEQEGFKVAYNVLPCGKRYKYEDIGKWIYIDKDVMENDGEGDGSMNGTNVICNVKECKFCKLSGCKRKAIVLDNEGNCLSKEIITGKDAADGAAQDAAEGVLMYGA